MFFVKRPTISLYLSTEEITTMTNQEDFGIKTEEVLVRRVYAHDAYLMETFQRP